MARLIGRIETALASHETVSSHPTIKVAAGSGFGEWAKVPWIAFLDSRETDTTQRGVYVVLLVKEDCSGFFLTFNQGVTEPTKRLGAAGGKAEVRDRASGLRNTPYVRELQSRGFALDDALSLADRGLGGAYEVSTIAHKYYPRGEIPHDDELMQDVGALLQTYEAYVRGRGTVTPVHLLLKWARDREPRTVELHQAVAERAGSVWWGKFGNAGVSSDNLARIRAQLAAGDTTHVFLSGAGTVWQTTLEEITEDRQAIDDAHFPGYYRRDECAFFCRLSHFTPSSREWLIANTVLDSDPENSQSASNAINSSANPAYLRIVGEKPVSTPATPRSGLCLIGTWRDVRESFEWVRNASNGGRAVPWSFPVRKEAQALLTKPFDLYINAGSGRIVARLAIADYVTSQGNEGRTSPWPEITETEWIGKTRQGDEPSGVFKTWLRVTGAEMLDPPLQISDFEPAEGLSLASSLLSAVTFGYAYRRSGDPMEALMEETLLDRGTLESMVAAVSGSSPQIVLAGPPGTSKTWIAQAIARHVAGDASRTRLVQFHPNYSYEAFVEGLRPHTDGGAITFKLQPGALLEMVSGMRAAEEGGQEAPLYVLVIDEMNRANLPRVFGELMYLFEYRDRKIRLQYSDFALPPNLRFVGTMNTADRSIRSIDIALRRRFDVFELKPDVELLKRFFANKPLSVPNLYEGFEKLNERLLKNDLDRHHTIGHAFFMKAGLNRTMLRAIWDRKIFPLIEEYFFDEPDTAAQYTFDAFWP